MMMRTSSSSILGTKISSLLLLLLLLLVVQLYYVFETSLNFGVNGYTPPSSSSSSSSKPPFIQRNDLIGIWKLTNSHFVVDNDDDDNENDDNDDQQEQSKDTNADLVIIEDIDDINQQENDNIVLRLNEDGTFDPYLHEPNPDDPLIQQILGRGGIWEYQVLEQSLILATNRRPSSNNNNNDDNSINKDTVLCGKLLVHTTQALEDENVIGSSSSNKLIEQDDNISGDDDDSKSSNNSISMDVQLSVPRGQILCGKYMYPQKHKAFFEAEPMLFRECCVGSFAISQLLGNLNTRLQKKNEEKNTIMNNKQNDKKFHKKDFYGRKFILVSSPHKVNPTYAAKDKHYNEDTANIDIRTIPIEFHSNNTFTAVGVEKILRGRYGTTTDGGKDQLWFQVSLFGAGRSAPGSVYSEGRLLNHDDRRGYIGTIQTITHNDDTAVVDNIIMNNTDDKNIIDEETKTKSTTQFFIDGEIYFGTDIKTPKKPNSMGLFSMQEILGEDDDDEEEFDDDDDDDEDDDCHTTFETPIDDDDDENAFQ